MANHQIRHLRALLIEDAINFEHKYHLSRIRRGRYNLAYARNWYLNSVEVVKRIPMSHSWPNCDVEVFCTSFLRSLLPNSDMLFPDIFNLDGDRLRLLQAEVEDLMYENICCEILVALLDHLDVNPVNDTTRAQARLRHDLQTIIGDGRFLAMPIGNISVELVRHALRLSGSSAKTDAELVDLTESWLQRAHSDPERQQYHAEKLYRELFSETIPLVLQYLTSSPWDIFNILVAPVASRIATKAIPGTSSVRPSKRAGIVNRITHIAVLHWRIWERIVYNNDEIVSPNFSPADPHCVPLGSQSRSRSLAERVQPVSALKPQTNIAPIAQTSNSTASTNHNPTYSNQQPQGLSE